MLAHLLQTSHLQSTEERKWIKHNMQHQNDKNLHGLRAAHYKGVVKYSKKLQFA